MKMNLLVMAKMAKMGKKSSIEKSVLSESGDHKNK